MRHASYQPNLFLLCVVGFALLIPHHASFAFAARADELKEKINSRNTEIEQLERDIKQYEKELTVINKEKSSLKNTIRSFDISIKKFSTDIAVTHKKIAATTESIGELVRDIAHKENKIVQRKSAMAEVIRSLHEAETHTLAELVLSHVRLSDVWNDIAGMSQFQEQIGDNLAELQGLKQVLETNKQLQQQRKDELSHFKEMLSDKKSIVEYNKEEKGKILEQTKNKETEYETLLEEKKVRREQFLADLLELESQLQLEIDPASLPIPGTKVLSWPLDTVRITQYFGNTEFAKSAQAYKGQGHNGIDLQASVGTSVKAALAGTVTGAGNTDAISGCYSYGKWILIKHSNNLSTLYAHLSVIKVAEGQEVATGETIGFSGNTGYSTGPHLHFTVYATQGVRVQQFSKSISCKNATIPIADLKAYLNPLQYL